MCFYPGSRFNIVMSNKFTRIPYVEVIRRIKCPPILSQPTKPIDAAIAIGVTEYHP